jgi:hypothetical protein
MADILTRELPTGRLRLRSSLRGNRPITGKPRIELATRAEKGLMGNKAFAAAFREAKAQIRAMEYRYVEEADQVRQTLLEIYCAVALDTPYNDFGTQ